MGLKEDATTWLVSTALKKAIPKVVTAVCSMLAVKYGADLAGMGIHVDFDTLSISLVSGAVAALDMFRNFVKVKTGIKEL